MGSRVIEWYTDIQAVEEIRKQGIDKLDVVIANAAINLACGVGFKDVDVDLQEETFRINVSLETYPFQSLQPLRAVRGPLIRLTLPKIRAKRAHVRSEVLYSFSKLPCPY